MWDIRNEKCQHAHCPAWPGLWLPPRGRHYCPVKEPLCPWSIAFQRQEPSPSILSLSHIGHGIPRIMRRMAQGPVLSVTGTQRYLVLVQLSLFAPTNFLPKWKVIFQGKRPEFFSGLKYKACKQIRGQSRGKGKVGGTHRRPRKRDMSFKSPNLKPALVVGAGRRGCGCGCVL